MGAAGAVPGFPIGGGTNPRGGGVPTYYLAKFSPKMHENENISGHGGVACWEDPPLDPPLLRYHIQDDICHIWTLKLFTNWGVNIGRQFLVGKTWKE